MADDYTNTAEHRIAVPAITDQWNFTREITNLRTRLNQGLRGAAAYNVDGTNYVLSADNAGSLLSRGGGFPRGSIIGAASAQDPYLTFYLNTGAALSGVWSAGVDDSDSDKFKIESDTSIGTAPELTIDTSGNITAGSGTSSLLDVTGNLTLRSAALQVFQVQLYNNAGTLQHQIISVSISGAGAATFSDRIVGASATLQNTPSVSSIVDFTTGVGINAANTEQIVFNTAVQPAVGLMRIIAIITGDNTGSTLKYIEPMTSNINVNGTTRVRFTIKGWKADRTVWAFNTTNIPSGTIVDVTVFGFIA
ncbi:MAG: hypothetical protein NUW01_12775 [Gemmatimonadaceae bacterium]|nr:hypothetical protein [Gemmatimonadaceae bacterium]